jgi:hypothetical protein
VQPTSTRAPFWHQRWLAVTSDVPRPPTLHRSSTSLRNPGDHRRRSGLTPGRPVAPRRIVAATIHPRRTRSPPRHIQGLAERRTLTRPRPALLHRSGRQKNGHRGGGVGRDERGADDGRLGALVVSRELGAARLDLRWPWTSRPKPHAVATMKGLSQGWPAAVLGRQASCPVVGGLSGSGERRGMTATRNCRLAPVSAAPRHQTPSGSLFSPASRFIG